jgi:hypothetical protein
MLLSHLMLLWSHLTQDNATRLSNLLLSLSPADTMTLAKTFLPLWLPGFDVSLLRDAKVAGAKSTGIPVLLTGPGSTSLSAAWPVNITLATKVLPQIILLQVAYNTFSALSQKAA